MGAAQVQKDSDRRASSLLDRPAVVQREGVPFDVLGTVGGDRLVIDDVVDLPVSQVAEVWSAGLERAQ